MCPRVRHEATISRALNWINAHKRHIFIMEATDTIYTFLCSSVHSHRSSPAAIMHAVQVSSSAPSLMTLGTSAEAHWLLWFQRPQRGFVLQTYGLRVSLETDLLGHCDQESTTRFWMSAGEQHQKTSHDEIHERECSDELKCYVGPTLWNKKKKGVFLIRFLGARLPCFWGAQDDSEVLTRSRSDETRDAGEDVSRTRGRSNVTSRVVSPT